MINNMFSATTIPVLEQVVNFAQTRHSILAGNIANLDTPGYRARDLSPEMFEAKLKQALVDQDQQGIPVSESQIAPNSRDPVGQVSKSLEDILYHDDSTGSLEKQVSAVSENQIQHNLALTILSSQFRLLQTAISERV